MFRFDHAIIAVDDLIQAAVRYEDMGFTVIEGGKHANQATHNALIVFKDGSYIELMALTGEPPLPDHADYSYLLQDGAGLVGYAFATADIQSTVKSLQSRGVALNHPVAGGRKRPDGVELRWQTAMIGRTVSPFFIQDDTPRDWRIPHDDASVQHRNGATGINSLSFLVADLQSGMDRYQQILNVQATYRTDRNALFVMGELLIGLFLPFDESQRNLLNRRPLAPYQLVVSTYDDSHLPGELKGTAHGTQTLVVR